MRYRHRATVRIDDSPAHSRHPSATIAKLVRPGGVRAVVAESLVLKHQLLISRRARRRAPNLNSFDRFLLGLGSLFVPPSRLPKLAVILKPRTLFRFHEALKKRKYRWLFSSGGHRRPGPKGPSRELIDAMVGALTRRTAKQLIWCNVLGWPASYLKPNPSHRPACSVCGLSQLQNPSYPQPPHSARGRKGT